MCIYVNIYIYVHTYTHTEICTYKQNYIYINIHTYDIRICIYIYTYMYIIRTNDYDYTYAYMTNLQITSSPGVSHASQPRQEAAGGGRLGRLHLAEIWRTLKHWELNAGCKWLLMGK